MAKSQKTGSSSASKKARAEKNPDPKTSNPTPPESIDVADALKTPSHQDRVAADLQGILALGEGGVGFDVAKFRRLLDWGSQHLATQSSEGQICLRSVVWARKLYAQPGRQGLPVELEWAESLQAATQRLWRHIHEAKLDKRVYHAFAAMVDELVGGEVVRFAASRTQLDPLLRELESQARHMPLMEAEAERLQQDRRSEDQRRVGIRAHADSPHGRAILALLLRHRGDPVSTADLLDVGCAALADSKVRSPGHCPDRDDLRSKRSVQETLRALRDSCDACAGGVPCAVHVGFTAKQAGLRGRNVLTDAGAQHAMKQRCGEI